MNQYDYRRLAWIELAKHALHHDNLFIKPKDSHYYIVLEAIYANEKIPESNLRSDAKNFVVVMSLVLRKKLNTDIFKQRSPHIYEWFIANVQLYEGDFI